MFKNVRYASVKIKEVFDCNKKEDIDRLKTKIASKSTSAETKKEAEKLVTAIEPNHLYIHVTALRGDISNANGDYFRWDELLKKKEYGDHSGKYMFATWVGCPVLENHDSSKIRGTIVDAFPIRNDKTIEFLLRIDEKTNPNMVKGIRNGSITGTSMGVSVSHSYCGICKNLAYTEDDWCEHLHPKALNIKGKIYTGQDGNKYPDKLGQLVYEDNRDLEGVEDSIITLGEPAEEKAIIHKVLASTKEEENMPIGNNRPVESSNRYIGGNNSGGISARASDDSELSSAVANLLAKKGLVFANGRISKSAGVASDYESSTEVLQAIKEGKLKKADAISYVEKFRLATANEIDNLTPTSAIELLKKDSDNEPGYDAVIADIVNAQSLDSVKDGGDQADDTNKAKPEDQPKPAGSVNPSGQMPSTDPGKQSDDTNKAKPEDQPKPQGTVNAQSLDSVKDGGDQALSAGDAKPEMSAPTPQGKVNVDSQMPSTVISDESTIDEAKHEDQPTPDGSIDPHGQMPSTDPGKQADDTNKAKPGERPAPEGSISAKRVKADDINKSELEGMGEEKQIDRLLDLIEDAQMIAEELKGGEKEEEKKEDKEPKEDKKEEDKKPPFMEKKDEDSKESPVPTPDKEPSLPPLFSSYEARFVENKNAKKSHYIVSCKGNDVLLLTAEDVQHDVETFKSDEFKNTLVATLNSKGARKVHEEDLFGFGIVLGQADLPEDKFDAPAGPMNADPSVVQDMANNDLEDNKANNFSDLILETLATNIATSDKASVEEVINEMKDIFSSEENSNHFSGMLREKVENKKKEMHKDDTAGGPDAGLEDLDMGMDAGGPPPAEPAPDTKTMEAQKKLVSAFTKLLPALKQEIVNTRRERDEYKNKYEARLKDDMLKARISKTTEIAVNKANLGLINKKDIKAEAVKLAKLTDDELGSELKLVENSIKIARNLSKNSKEADYVNIEGNKTNTSKSVLASIPSQQDNDVIEPQKNSYGWSNRPK